MQLLRYSARVRILIFAIVQLSATPFLHAQLVGGTIAGDVADPNNASVVGAQVQIRNEETGGVRELVTAQGGAFRSLGGSQFTGADLHPQGTCA